MCNFVSMNIEELSVYCQSLPCVTASIQWETVLVFKVGGKIFCFADLDDEPHRMNLKCDPEEAIELRETYSAVMPGYHMNKRYWNTVLLDGSIEDCLLHRWIDNSFHLVVTALPLKKQRELGLSSDF